MNTRDITVGIFLVVAAASIGSASYSGTEVYLPSIGSGPGFSESYWETSIWVFNPNETAADVQFFFLLRAKTNPNPAVFNVTIPPGETRRWDNAAGTLFGIEGFGAIRVVSSQPVVVNSRTYSTPAGGGATDSVGQFLAAIPRSFALTVGESTNVLGGFQTDPQDDSVFRFNFGLVETNGGSVEVQVRAIDELENLLASRTYNLGPHGARQWNISHLGPIDHENFRLEAEILSGDGGAVVFGTVLANKSNDPATFQMTVDASSATGVSGITEVVAGDGLTGGGSGGSVRLDIEAGQGLEVGANSISLAQAIDVAIIRALAPNGSLNAVVSGSSTDPDSGFISVHDASGYVGLGLLIEDATNAGSVALYGNNGALNAWFGSSLAHADHGSIGLYDSGGYLQSELSLLETGEGFAALYGPNGELNLNLTSNYYDPNSGAIALRNEYGDSSLLLIVDEADYGAVETYGPSGNLNTMMATSSGGDDYGWVGVFDPWGEVQASMYVDTNGWGYVWASGSYAVTQHPSAADQAIVYSHPQGPESTVFVRGTVDLVDGRATIPLPEHFAATANMSTASVQLTPHSLASEGLGVASIGQNAVVIGELRNGRGDYQVSYHIQAVRRGDENREVLVPLQAVRQPGALLGGATSDLEAAQSTKKRQDSTPDREKRSRRTAVQTRR
jgi:hypothetical protein